MMGEMIGARASEATRVVRRDSPEGAGATANLSTPVLELVEATIVRDLGDGLVTEYQELKVPAARLRFQYP